MCFSQTASFTAATLLVSGGAYAIWKAQAVNMRYVPLAMMPVLAGLQQFMEGHVWMGLDAAYPDMVWQAAMGFIFFSWLMWPTWIPFSMYALEPSDSERKQTLLVFAVAGLFFGLLLYVPHLINPDWVKVAIIQKSISYEDTMFLDYFVPRELTYFIYLVLIITPPILSHYLHMRIFGITLILVVLVVWGFLSYAYISFFCLLAGLGTIHLIYIIVTNKCIRECPEIFG